MEEFSIPNGNLINWVLDDSVNGLEIEPAQNDEGEEMEPEENVEVEEMEPVENVEGEGNEAYRQR